MIRIIGNEKVEKAKDIDYGNETFCEDQLLKLWSLYAKQVKEKEGGFSGSVLSNCLPKLLKDGKTVHIIFRTESSKQAFQRMSEDLLLHLKASLKNNHINFTTEVNKEKAKKVIVTNREKFDYLIKKYPQLRDWEIKLGLDLK